MGPNEFKKYYDDVARQGRASFKVIFKAAPDDDDFSKLEPVARVIVVAKDPTPGAKPLQ